MGKKRCASDGVSFNSFVTKAIFSLSIALKFCCAKEGICKAKIKQIVVKIYLKCNIIAYNLNTLQFPCSQSLDLIEHYHHYYQTCILPNGLNLHLQKLVLDN